MTDMNKIRDCRMRRFMKMLSKLQEGGFFHVLSGGVLSKLVAFLSSVIVVRIVDKTAYAKLAYADNIYNYIVLLAGLGMSSAVLKYCVQKEESKNRAYYRFSFVWGTLFQILLLVFVLLYALQGSFPFDGTKQMLVVLLPYGLLYYWVQLFQSFLRTRFENKKYAVSSFVQVLLTLLFTIPAVQFFDIYGVPLSRSLAMGISILMYLPVIIRYRKEQKEIAEINKEEIKAFLTMALSLLISNVFSMIMPYNEAFLVNNIIKDSVTTANYKVANLIPSQLPFVTSTIVIYFFPIIAQKAIDEETWTYIKRIGIGTFIVNFAIAILGCVMTPIIISLAYGDAYSDINSLSIALWCAYMVNSGFRMLPLNLLPALGYVKFNVIVAAISSIVLFGLDYVLILNVGIYGVVLARIIINTTSAMVYWIYLRNKCVNLQRGM